MYRQSPLALIGILILVIVAVNLVISLGMPHVALPPWLADAIVIAIVVYVAAAIALRGRLRLRKPSFRRRPRMRAVPRDPSKAAADFIRQFEDRAK